jgi:flagellar basal-body rod protein FlgB
MQNNIESITTGILSKALDAASLRQQTIAMNIANVNTPGYNALTVNFSEQLEAAKKSLEMNGKLEGNTFSEVNPFAEVRVNFFGNPTSVKLDQEVAEMAENTVLYQSLIKGISRHFSILSTAVSDGKK